MNILRFAWLGGVLGVLFTVALQVPLTSAEAKAEPEPGKVIFKSPSTSYEYPVGTGNHEGKEKPKSNSNFFTKETISGQNENENDLKLEIDQTNEISANTFLTTTASASTTTEASSKPRLIFPGFTAQNLTEPTISTKDRKRRNTFERNNYVGEESRRIGISIRPMAAASENTNVEVRIQKTISSSGEDSKSNEVVEEEKTDTELEKRKRDCRGLPWPFVNALNATNCLDLDEEEFSAKLINQDDEEDEDEDDATIVLPKKRRKKPVRGGNRRYQAREEDYDEDTPYDPFHSPLPKARSYHEWAMMLRDMAPPEDGYYRGGPVSYQDFHQYYRNPYEEQTNTPTGGWEATQPPPTTGWGWTTAQPQAARQPHELKNSFGQPSQPGQVTQTASFGQPSTGAQGKAVSFGQPSPQGTQGTQAPPSFGQPAPAPQQVQPTTPAPAATQTNQTAGGSRQGKALEFGTPSQQQVVTPPQTLVQPPTQQQQQQFQQRVGQPANPTYNGQQAYLAPGYYAPTTPSPYGYGYSQTTQASNGWGQQSTTKGWGWGETTTTTTQAPPPQYQQPQVQSQQQQQQPSYGQMVQPSPTVFPIFQNYNQSTAAPPPQAPPPQLKPQQQVLVLPITDPAMMNQTQVMDLYNRLLSLYKVVINDTNQPQPQQPVQPAYQPPNPWQVPPPQQVWAGALAAQRGFDGYYPEEILPGIQDDYLYDPLDQPKLLPRPISPVGRKGRQRQLRRRNSRRNNDDEDEPRVSFMNDGPTILHEVTNNEEFLPRRRYFKRKIDENELKKTKTKKNLPRRWGSGSRDDGDEDLDYETDPFYERGHKHPNVPSWLRQENYDYLPPVYGQPPPAESSGGWGQPTPPPPATGWGWPETTTAAPGWGWPAQTTTTAKPGWGWGGETTTTTTTTTQAPPQQEGQQQNEADTTEEGPKPGQQWAPPNNQSPQFQAYLQQVNDLIRQLQQSGQLPNYQPQQQQQQQQQPPQYGPQQVQQQQQQPTQAPPTPQQVQQPAPQSQKVGGQSQDSVIEDIGRNDPTSQTPAFRDQPPPAESVRSGTARQLFSGEVQDQNNQQGSIVSTVTSTSVSESVAPTPAPGGAENQTQQPSAAQIQTSPQQPQQVSNGNGMSTPPPQTVSAAPLNAYSSPALQQAAARQLRYSPSAMAEPTGRPSWGSWGGAGAQQQQTQISYAPTYSKVQDALPFKQDGEPSYQYNILKRAGDSSIPSLIETLSEAKKIDTGDDENRPSLVARVVD